MLDEISTLRSVVETDLAAIDSAAAAEAFRLKHLVRKGTIAGLFDRLREVPKELKREVGQALNELRTLAETTHAEAQERFARDGAPQADPRHDVTLPPRRLYTGHQHPIMRAKGRIEEIFTRMGFTIASGPDVEDDYHNFEALNFPADHPARDMQDTFFVKAGEREDLLLRTHTSPVQVRLMMSRKPPIRAIMPGRVYRNETITARAGAASEIRQPRPVQHREIALKAGEQLAFAPAVPPVIAPVNLQQVTAWTAGQLIFDNEPLSVVAERVNRYGAAQILIEDPSVADLRISGVFNAGDVAGVVDIITQYLPVQAVKLDDARLGLRAAAKKRAM